MNLSYHSNFLEEWDNIFKVWNISVNSNGDLHFLPFKWKYTNLGIKWNDRKDYEQLIPISELEEFNWITRELFKYVIFFKKVWSF